MITTPGERLWREREREKMEILAPFCNGNRQQLLETASCAVGISLGRISPLQKMVKTGMEQKELPDEEVMQHREILDASQARVCPGEEKR